jgi:uncharacterized membrane protein HdeD (DUF308 family)
MACGSRTEKYARTQIRSKRSACSWASTLASAKFVRGIETEVLDSELVAENLIQKGVVEEGVPSSNLSMAAVARMNAVFAEHRTLFTLLGILLIVLGVLAIMFPLVTTIAAKKFLGWLFLIGGIAQVVHAFSTRSWSEFLLDLLVGLLYALVGAWLAFFPLTGILTLTVLLAITFVLQGGAQIGMSFRMRPHSGWFWMLLAGIIAILAGAMIVAGLPSTATWAVGILVGVNLLTSGWAYLILALGAKESN